MGTGDVLAQSPTAVNNLTPYQAALWYRERGLFPIPWIARDGKKIVAFSNFSYDQYTSDPRAVEWVVDSWAYEPNWQVGLALNENSGLFAVDVDDPEQLAAWESAHGPIQDGTWTQTTGREGGGQHRLFLAGGRGFVWPKQGPFDAAHRKLEFRSNGLLGVSPSIHPSGRRYQWTSDSPVEIARPNWGLISLLSSRAARRDTAPVSGGTHARVQADGTRAYVSDMDALLVSGIPAGQSQHDTLRDLVWDATSRGMSDVMIRVLWETVVARTPLTRPDQPWTGADFDRHLAGARQKLGGGIDPELMKWAVRIHNTPLSSKPSPQADTPQSEKAVEPEPSGKDKGESKEARRNNPLRPMAYAELKQYGSHQAGMGELFADRFHEVFKWCNEENAYYTWFSFRGEKVTSWQRESFTGLSPKFVYMVRKLGEVVRECVFAYADTVDQNTAEGKVRVKEAFAYLTPFQKADAIRGIAKIVVSDQRVAVTAMDFVAKPYMLNFRNGTYNVKTGKLQPHRLEDMHTVTIQRDLDLSLAEKDLGLHAPLFDSMLWRMCAAPGEVDDVTHALRVQAITRWLGYQLHGSNPEKKLGVFEGATSIGKNQIVEALGDIIAEYAYTSCPPALLVRSRQDRHSSVEAGLSGKRLVVVNELTKGQVLDEGQVLRLVNPEGTRIDLRKMRENAVSTEITWKLTVTTNAMPRTDTTEEILQRLAFLPLSKIPVPQEDRDPSLKGRILAAEADAILAHAVTWWREWWTEFEAGNRNALALPQESAETLKEFVDDNLTPLHEFVEEMCVVEEGGYIDAKELWRKAQGYWDDQHRDKRLEYSGGRRELFRIMCETPGVIKVTRGARKNLVGFRNVRVRAIYGEADKALSSWVQSVSN